MNWLVLVVCISCAASARAASLPGENNQAVPCRPTVSCIADFASPGTVEVELGYQLQRLTPPTLAHSIPFLVKLTLADWAQLQLGSNGPTFIPSGQPTRYVDNLTVGLKFHLRTQSRRAPSIAWSVAVGAPVDTAPGYQRAIDLSWTAYLSKDLGRFHLDFNAGVILWHLEGATVAQPWAAFAVSRALPRHFGLVAEVYYFAAARPFAADDGGLRVAASYSPRGWIVLDLGGDIGWFPSQRAVTVFAGFSVVPVALW